MEKDITPQNLSAEIFAVLKNRITHWEYLPNHRFTEIGLCEEFGVSRSPIREVLQMLEEKGLVVKIPRLGYTVRQPNLEEINELYEFRLAIETYIIERLTEQRLEHPFLKDLTEQWQAFITHIPAVDEDAATHDEHFHETLARALGNSILLKQVKEVNERLHFIRVNDITSPQRWLLTCRQHLNILDTIHKGDVETARKSIKTNIMEGRQNVDEAVKDALSGAYLNVKTKAQGIDHI